MRSVLIFVLPMLLLSCSKAENVGDARSTVEGTDTTTPSEMRKEVGAPLSWQLLSNGEGVSLALEAAGKPAIIRLFCPTSENMLKVNVQSFRPIGSEERLSVGAGNNAATLVADSRGDLALGGVSGTGAVPKNLATLITGPISVNYGAQNSGPHVAPPQDLAQAFVTACNEGRDVAETSKQQIKSAEACMMQDGKILRLEPRRAIGTEPFWGARIDGRCVLYSHIEDQKGTRVWTRYTKDQAGEIWSGALNGQLFELKIRKDTQCSDGMSDKRYSMAVDLKVDGELRQGCAEPI